MTLGRRTASAAIWLVGARFFAKSTDLALLLILTYLITPADFGLVALAMTFVTIAQAVIDIPIAAAIVRSKNPDRVLLDTAFTVSILRGAILLLLLISGAALASIFYDDDRLLPLIFVLSVFPLAAAFKSPRIFLYDRDLDFRPTVVAEIVGKFSAFVIGLTIALTLRNYWGLAAATVTTAVMTTVMSYVLAPYRPRLSVQKFRAFLDILGWSSLAQIASTINWQIDRIILGAWVPGSSLGLYYIAQTMTATPQQMIVVPIMQPFLSAFRQKSTREEIEEIYLKASAGTFTLVAPVFVLIAITAAPVCALLMDDDFGGTAALLSGLALSTIATLPTAPIRSLMVAHGRTVYVAIQDCLILCLSVPTTALLIWTHGVEGAVWSKFFILTGGWLIGAGLLKYAYGMTFRRQIAVHAHAVVGLVVLAVCAGAVTAWAGAAWPEPGYALLALILVCVWGVAGAAYLLTIWALWRLSGEPPGLVATVVALAEAQVRRLTRSRL